MSKKMNTKTITLKTALSTLILGSTFLSGFAVSAQASTDALPPPAHDWHHKGIFGTYDRAALQRGFKVYKEVCATCHSLERLSYRNLTALGFSEAEVKAIADDYEVVDGPNDEGLLFNRKALPSDRFASPFANEKAARAANNGALPVDLSLITKARSHGEDYVRAVLTGYRAAPEGMVIPEGMHYNMYFPGNKIVMPQMLNDEAVQYDDGTPSTAEQQATDVVSFLAWAADPHMEARKQMGIKVIVFLSAFAGFMYLLKRKIWQKLK